MATEKLTKQQKSDLWEIFLLEIGFWVKVNGQITENTKYPWESKESLQEKFKTWMNREKKAAKAKSTARRR